MKCRGVNPARAALVLSLLIGSGSALIAQQEEVRRSIEPVAGDVYYFHNNNHNGIFVVTAEGVILVDPINSDAGEWLKQQIAERFGQTVRVIIYSHYHGDHSGGAEAYADTVEEIIAHENTSAGILEGRPRQRHANPYFLRSPYRGARQQDRRARQVGPGHTDDLIAVRFPEAGVLFVVDIFSGKRLPFPTGASFEVDTMVGTLRHIERMDFRILAPGHTGLSTGADLVAYRTFLENLRAQVLQLRPRGQDGRRHEAADYHGGLHGLGQL